MSFTPSSLSEKQSGYLRFLFFLIVIAIPLFAHLEELPIQLWDEGRLAMKAVEMSRYGNWLVPSYFHVPDMISVKPPLLTWIQVIFIKILGEGELAIRLPSALAAFAVCLMFYWLLEIKYKFKWMGILASFVFVTSRGVIFVHSSRTGDYDAMLTLFTFSYSLTWFLFIEEEKRKYYWWSCLFILLAYFVKDIQGMMFLPTLLVYAALRKKLKLVFFSPATYLGVVAILVPIVLYYVAREKLTPGYFQSVLDNDMIGRYASTIENHLEPPLHYVDQLIKYKFNKWWWMLVPGLWFGLRNRNELIKHLTQFCLVTGGLYIFILSLAKTKIFWYLMPAFPMLAIIVAIFIYHIFNALMTETSLAFFEERLKVRTGLKNLIAFIFLVFIFFEPYAAVLDVVFAAPPLEEYMPSNNDMAEYLKEVVVHDKKLPPNTTIGDINSENIAFYAYVLEKANLPLKIDYENKLEKADHILVWTIAAKRRVEQHYINKHIDSIGAVVLYKIEGVRDTLLK